MFWNAAIEGLWMFSFLDVWVAVALFVCVMLAVNLPAFLACTLLPTPEQVAERVLERTHDPFQAQSSFQLAAEKQQPGLVSGCIGVFVHPLLLALVLCYLFPLLWRMEGDATPISDLPGFAGPIFRATLLGILVWVGVNLIPVLNMLVQFAPTGSLFQTFLEACIMIPMLLDPVIGVRSVHLPGLLACVGFLVFGIAVACFLFLIVFAVRVIVGKFNGVAARIVSGILGPACACVGGLASVFMMVRYIQATWTYAS